MTCGRFAIRRKASCARTSRRSRSAGRERRRSGGGHPDRTGAGRTARCVAGHEACPRGGHACWSASPSDGSPAAGRPSSGTHLPPAHALHMTGHLRLGRDHVPARDRLADQAVLRGELGGVVSDAPR